jgi:hypothetical protein
MCDCVKITYSTGDVAINTIEVNASGTYNGANYYTWTDAFNTYFLFWNLGQWEFSYTLGGPELAFIKDGFIDCPDFSNAWITEVFTDLITEACEPDNCGLEDRIYRNYDSIKLPQSFAEQDRGLADCCCVALVLGSSAESWKNDKTSFWMKLSDDLDSVTFDLLDCEGNIVESFSYTAFPNEPNAYYATCDWGVVLATYGQGSYSLGMTYSISGVVGQLLWGDYKLLPYSIQNALKTARVSAIFNGKQMIDGIDFTNSNVESTHRFYGYIGNRQPNMEIDNIIYDNREMKRVIRENLNDYEIITDPEDECILRPLLELFLISENELFISDYNAHNHSYRYLDLPVIVSESPAVEYKDFSRKAVLKCKVADKFKNSRTFY